MITVILIIHVILAVCIILVVLMQKSEGGGLGIGGSSAGGGFMTARGTANFMTKLTAFLGGCFFWSERQYSKISRLGPFSQRKKQYFKLALGETKSCVFINSGSELIVSP